MRTQISFNTKHLSRFSNYGSWFYYTLTLALKEGKCEYQIRLERYVLKGDRMSIAWLRGETNDKVRKEADDFARNFDTLLGKMKGHLAFLPKGEAKKKDDW